MPTTPEINKEDAALATAYVLAASASVGIANVTLFQHSLTDVVFSAGGQGITWALLITAAVLGYVYWEHEPDLDRIRSQWGEYYYYAIIGTAVLVLGIAFVPTVHDFVTSSDVFALAAVVVEGAGYVAMAYMG